MVVEKTVIRAEKASNLSNSRIVLGERLFEALSLLVTLLISLKVCKDCGRVAESNLAYAGLGVSFLRLLLPWREMRHCCTVLIGVGGLVLSGVAAISGLAPCTLCIVFWCLQVPLLFGALAGRQRISSLFAALLLLAAVMVSSILLVPTSRAYVAGYLPKKGVTHGPIQGDQLPFDVNHDVGYVILVTDCAPCLIEHVGRITTILEEQRVAYTLAAVPQQSELILKLTGKSAKPLSQKDLEGLRLQASGYPVIVRLANGRVHSTRPLSLFKPEEVIP